MRARISLVAVLTLALLGALGCQTLAVCDDACASACGGLISPRDEPGPAPREARAPSRGGRAAMAF